VLLSCFAAPCVSINRMHHSTLSSHSRLLMATMWTRRVCLFAVASLLSAGVHYARIRLENQREDRCAVFQWCDRSEPGTTATAIAPLACLGKPRSKYAEYYQDRLRFSLYLTTADAFSDTCSCFVHWCIIVQGAFEGARPLRVLDLCSVPPPQGRRDL
jgi:hypothetical protein